MFCRHDLAPKGHPFCPPNHAEKHPMRLHLLNKYVIEQFPKPIRHKIPHLLFLAATRASFVDMDKFLTINFAANAEYCEKVLDRINIAPPSGRTKKQHQDLHETLFGEPFTPTIDDDAFLSLVHEIPVVDEHYLSKFNDLIVSSVFERKYDYQIDLWHNNHWDRAIQLLQLYNTQISANQFIQVLGMLNLTVYALKEILKIYLFECKKLRLKQLLNEMPPTADQIAIDVSADANTLEHLEDLLKGCADSCTSLQYEFIHDLKMRREWEKFKIKHKNSNNPNSGKIEIDDENENNEEQDENENKMEPRPNEIFNESTNDRMLGLILKTEEYIRELKKESDVFSEICLVNFNSRPCGMLF